MNGTGKEKLMPSSSSVRHQFLVCIINGRGRSSDPTMKLGMSLLDVELTIVSVRSPYLGADYSRRLCAGAEKVRIPPGVSCACGEVTIPLKRHSQDVRMSDCKVGRDAIQLAGLKWAVRSRTPSILTKHEHHIFNLSTLTSSSFPDCSITSSRLLLLRRRNDSPSPCYQCPCSFRSCRCTLHELDRIRHT